jgi:hypothetical protein
MEGEDDSTFVIICELISRTLTVTFCSIYPSLLGYNRVFI